MSDYLTNLAITLTNAEPAIRPRLGARFESLRPHPMAQGLAPAVNAPALDGLEVGEPDAGVMPGEILAAPPSRAPASPMLIAEAPRGATRPKQRQTQPPTVSEHSAIYAPVESSTQVQQAPFASRNNPEGAPPRQPPQPPAAEVRPRESAPGAVAETAPSTRQSQGKAVGIASAPAFVEENRRTPTKDARLKSMSAGSVSQPAATRTPRLAQPIQPVTPQPERIMSRKLEPALHPFQSDMSASLEPPSDKGLNWRNPRAQEAKKQPVAESPDIEPVMARASRQAPSVGVRPEAGTLRATPTIRVTIGRVEVRAMPPGPEGAAPAQRSKVALRKPVVSLEEYLSQRNGGRR